MELDNPATAFLALIAAAVLFMLWARAAFRLRKHKRYFTNASSDYQKQISALSHRLDLVSAENEVLAPYRKVRDAEGEAARILADANRDRDEIRRVIKERDAESKEKAKARLEEARIIYEGSASRAAGIVADAEQRAEATGGRAMRAAREADELKRTVEAMRNTIEGYGDRYLKPAESVLDDLAEEFSHKHAGRQLRVARDYATQLINDGKAAKSKFLRSSHRDGAEAFVLEAFNGKVDSILSRVTHDNLGTLEQEIRDAFAIVNHGGKTFREARITDAYLDARLEELRWAVAAHELKQQELEEQRRIKAEIREEQRAQREYERARRQAEKEEKVLRKAMEQARAQIEAATAEQRAEYEAQLAELTGKLQEAEERNRRALSMAQQTRRGHVYIISNVGSFGEGVYKIGLTRRLEPLDRVKELGDASVPFEFDVHAIILADDAPALETRLHKHFVMNQLNKVNHRKEFFRADLAEIRREIEAMGIETHWTMLSEAREFRESVAIDRAIAEDPAVREAWVNRQLTLDPVSHEELAEIEL